MTIQDLLDRNPELDLPILSNASFTQTFNTEIQWEVGGVPWFNYTEIHRWPYRTPAPELSDAHPELFDPRDEEMEEKLLLSIENTLRNGVRFKHMDLPLRHAGGVKFFLDREYEDGDSVVIHVLRWPTWTRWDEPGGSISHDLICEFSVEVRPG